ncbi:hypothetical protein QBC44DRAFT_364192 [Cladorrhinum sp. PSN332]|nr:hypothetical protein QBC44DRAFT_364192 [Cladorrhinum sp. PSN332]
MPKQETKSSGAPQQTQLFKLTVEVHITEPLALPGGIVLLPGTTLPVGTALPLGVLTNFVEPMVNAVKQSNVVVNDHPRSSDNNVDMSSSSDSFDSSSSSDSDDSSSSSESESGYETQSELSSQDAIAAIRRRMVKKIQAQLRAQPRSHAGCHQTLTGQWSCKVRVSSRRLALKAIGQKDPSRRGKPRNKWTMHARELGSIVGHVGFLAGRPMMHHSISGEVCVVWNEEKNALFLHGDYSFARVDDGPMPTSSTNPLKRKR